MIPPAIQEIARADVRDRKTLNLGGATCTALAQILGEQRATYQTWMTTPGSIHKREVASLRLITIEEVLRQLGVSLEEET